MDFVAFKKGALTQISLQDPRRISGSRKVILALQNMSVCHEWNI